LKSGLHRDTASKKQKHKQTKTKTKVPQPRSISYWINIRIKVVGIVSYQVSKTRSLDLAPIRAAAAIRH
jgi:hypothetical protein